jgi:hypothetical protein
MPKSSRNPRNARIVGVPSGRTSSRFVRTGMRATIPPETAAAIRKAAAIFPGRASIMRARRRRNRAAIQEGFRAMVVLLTPRRILPPLPANRPRASAPNSMVANRGRCGESLRPGNVRIFEARLGEHPREDPGRKVEEMKGGIVQPGSQSERGKQPDDRRGVGNPHQERPARFEERKHLS